MNEKELLAAREAEDWNALWSEAIPRVWYMARELKHEKNKDLIAAGTLAAGEAVRTWDPAKGTFTTHINFRVRRAMLDHLRLRAMGDIGFPRPRPEQKIQVLSVNPPDFEVLSESPGDWKPELTYGDAVEIPGGYGDPGEALQRSTATDDVQAILSYNDEETGRLLRALYGVGEPEVATPEYAARTGLGERRVRRIARRVRARLSDRDESGDKERHKIRYSPRVSQTHVPANWRWPGFWNGLVGVMGTRGGWRESAGNVWNDWSWKPTRKKA
jgi:hypothetical protein